MTNKLKKSCSPGNHVMCNPICAECGVNAYEEQARLKEEYFKKYPLEDLKILHCPWNKCEGVLELISSYSTDMYYEDYNRNSNTELFSCKVCGHKFQRTYTWLQMK